MSVQLNSRQQMAASRLLGIKVNSTWATLFQDATRVSANFKHDLFYDFGYPKHGELTFMYFYQMWRRNGLARALVEKTVGKTWEDSPSLLESQEAVGKETPIEAEIRQHFEDIRLWQVFRQADARSMVGKYGGVILQLGDGADYREPVKGRISGGVQGLISVLPAWEAQLTPTSWGTDPTKPDYGRPTMYTFNESSVDPENGKVRSFSIHPDRVLLWSEDGTTFGDSKLEPCYNALLDWEKIRGAGGEGFWKNAKSQPVLQADADVNFDQLATMLGTDLEGLPDALDEVIEKWTKGFDQSLLLQGMKAETIGVTLQEPEDFMTGVLQEIAASWPIPQKILTGMQTGERASTEDAREWAQTNKSRRTSIVVPMIMSLVRRMEAWQMIPDRDWVVDWADLTAPTLEEKISISEKMAKVNQAMFATGEAVFTDDEIREVAGYDPLTLPDLGDVDPIEPVTEGEDAPLT